MYIHIVISIYVHFTKADIVYTVQPANCKIEILAIVNFQTLYKRLIFTCVRILDCQSAHSSK